MVYQVQPPCRQNLDDPVRPEIGPKLSLGHQPFSECGSCHTSIYICPAHKYNGWTGRMGDTVLSSMATDATNMLKDLLLR